MKPILIALNYNNSLFLEDFLSTLEDQDIDDWEVYLLDDYSTDSTFEELIKIVSSANVNIKLIQNSENLGINRSIMSFIKDQKISDQRYIKLIATDDLIAPGALEIVKQELDQSIDLIYSDVYEIDQYGRVTCRADVIPENLFLRFETLFLFCNYYPATSSVVKAQFLKKALQSYPKVKNAEDWPLLVSLSEANCHVKKINYPTTYYRRHSDALSIGYYNNCKDQKAKLSHDVRQILLNNSTKTNKILTKFLIQIRILLLTEPYTYLKLFFILHTEYRRFKFQQAGKNLVKRINVIKWKMKKVLGSMGFRKKIEYEKLLSKYGEYCVNDLTGDHGKIIYESILRSQYKRYLKIISKLDYKINSTLDFGCGTGKFRRLLNTVTNGPVTGYDTSAVLLENCEKYDILIVDDHALQDYDFVFVHNVIGGMTKDELEYFIDTMVRIKNDRTIFMFVDVCTQDHYCDGLTWKAVDFETLFVRLHLIEIDRHYFYEHSNRLRISIAKAN